MFGLLEALSEDYRSKKPPMDNQTIQIAYVVVGTLILAQVAILWWFVTTLNNIARDVHKLRISADIARAIEETK